LCWIEFVWLARTFEGSGIFYSLPKLAPRAVSVEILPGATCQFKLASVRSQESEAHAVTITSDREKELQAALAQFIGLAARTSQLLEGQSAPVQQALGLEDGVAPLSKGSRSRKNKAFDK
jgi:hypothetical protein